MQAQLRMATRLPGPRRAGTPTQGLEDLPRVVGAPRRCFCCWVGIAMAASLGSAAPVRAYTAYVTNERDNTISVVDLDKMETVKTVPVGQRPRGIAISPDGKSLYVAAGDDDTVQI